MKPLWLKLKNEVLGKKYDLSFCFVASEEMRRLNKIYRKKNYSAAVLSFSLSPNEGEILINKNCQKNGGLSFYLFVHSLLHLSGLKHSQKMNKRELGIMKEFYPKNWEKIMGSAHQLI